MRKKKQINKTKITLGIDREYLDYFSGVKYKQKDINIT